jgi:hypothetical protein
MINRPFISCFLLAFCCPQPGYGGERAANASSFWKLGDIWTIHAEYFAPNEDTPVKMRLDASVANEAVVAGKPCRMIALICDGDLPDGTDIVIHAYIDKATGWPAKIVELESPFQAKLIDFGGKRVIAEALEFFPAEMFIPTEAGEFTAGKHRLIITNEKSNGQTKVGIALSENNTELWRVEQVWKDGELFWRSYEKHIKGRLTLKAIGVLHQAAKRTDAEKAKIAGIKTFAEDIEEKNKKIRDARPLLQDKRLHAIVHVEPERPSVAHVLRRLKEATGLDMEIDPELEKHVPDLGYISPSAKGYPAWQLMEHLAKIEIENPRWEKTAAGYRLSGVSKVPPGRQLVTSDDQPPPPPRRPFPWLPTSGVAVALIVTGLGVGFVVRRRRAKTASEKKTT